MRIAIIDLGTNTCSLLIAEIISEKYQILFQKNEAVRLGDGSIIKNILSEKANLRTIIALQNHKKAIKKYNVSKIKLIATSAVRTASNQEIFLNKIFSNTGLITEVISEEKEAELIYKGVLLAFDKIPLYSLILDIGGGSNELIITGKKEPVYKESFPAGMLRVINQFSISNPAKPEEINFLKKYFERIHINAFEMYKKYPGNTLIGCSGAFDTIADINDQVNPGEKIRKNQKISLDNFQKIFNELIYTTKDQRLKMKGMDPIRIDLIVPAVILVEVILKKTGITQIYQTDYTLREGVLYEMIYE